ncbi:Transposable element P transposase, partial [Frankliniella fusca]
MVKQNAKLEKNQVEKKVEILPPAQQQAVMACFEASKRPDAHGNRFHVEWVYECLLMRIKSPNLYEHIRRHKILVLPHRTTLNRYMRKLKPVYGFQSVLFDVLNKKLLDGLKEMYMMSEKCLVDIGDHTPEGDKNKAGDHALVILFRPHRGDWVQSLGAFPSKGNVLGPILAKMILEAIGLAEENCSMEHPQDENRRLFFFSDWSHLVKCDRNWWSPELPQKPTADNAKQTSTPRKRLSENGMKMTPQQIYEQKVHGALNKEVQKALLKGSTGFALPREEENLANRQGVAALTYVPGLSKKKIVFPDGFERMNVAMGYKFFSNSVRAGMEYYRKNVAVPELQDSEPTEKFIHKFNELCDTVNSHGPKDVIRSDNNGKLE